MKVYSIQLGNYCIQVSPFSASISIKKTLIKDKNGSYIIPQTLENESSSLRCEISALEQKLSSLRQKYEESITACAAAHNHNIILRNMLADRDNMINNLVKTEKVTVENSNIKQGQKKATFRAKDTHKNTRASYGDAGLERRNEVFIK